jgi:hypothetical protein
MTVAHRSIYRVLLLCWIYKRMLMLLRTGHGKMQEPLLTEGGGVDECCGDIAAAYCMSLQIRMRLQMHLKHRPDGLAYSLLFVSCSAASPC